MRKWIKISHLKKHPLSATNECYSFPLAATIKSEDLSWEALRTQFRKAYKKETPLWDDNNLTTHEQIDFFLRSSSFQNLRLNKKREILGFDPL